MTPLGVSDGLVIHVHQRGDVVRRRLAVRIHRKRVRESIDEQLVEHRRRVLVDVLLQQRTCGSRIDDGRAELLQVGNRAFDDGDAFLVRLVEERAVHVLANARRCGRRPAASRCAKLAYGDAGSAADAEHGELVLRVVAGDDVEHLRGVLDRAADRTGARVDSRRRYMPSRLTSSCVGARPTTALFLVGWRIEPPVSSAIAQVTRLAATDVPEPLLDVPADRSVS